MSSGNLTTSITRAVLRWLLGRRESSAAPDHATGRSVLTYGRPYIVVVSLMFALSTLLEALGIIVSDGDLKTLAICTLVFGTMWAGSAWALYEALYVRIEFSRDGLFRKAGNGRELHLSWQAVSKVTYSEAMSWLVFRAEGQGVIRISIFRNGLAALAAMTSQHLSGEPAAVVAALAGDAESVPLLGGQR